MIFRKKKKAVAAKRVATHDRSIIASYDAASRSPESHRHWYGADFLSADAALSSDVRRLVISRTRHEAANNGYLAGILATLADDCIGTGPRLQLSLCGICADGVEVEAWEKRLEHRERRWADWCERVGLCRKLKIARRAKAQDGEVFLRKSVNPKIKGLVKLDVTLYEAEQVGSNIIAATWDFYDNGTPKEVDGIFFDRYGNPTGYRFWAFHPGAMGGITAFDASYTVSAANVIHYANITRPGQHRGLPEISSSLTGFNDLRRFTNAVLSSAETAAEISFLLSTNTPPPDDEDDGGNSHLPPGTVVEFCRNAGLALPEGWQASQLKAEQPTSTYAEFLRTKIREASRPLSMPLNVALGDSSGYNYASGRLDHQTYFRTIVGERGLIGEVILDNLLESFEAFDKLYYPEDYCEADTTTPEIDHKWMWDGFAHVDPQKEANAQNIRLNSSQTTTLAEECGQDGKDFARVIRQRVREEYMIKQLRRQYGLDDVVATPAVPPNEGDDENDE